MARTQPVPVSLPAKLGDDDTEGGAWGRRIERVAWVVGSFASVIGVWALVVWLAHPASYVLPAPWDVARQLLDSRSLLLQNGIPTIVEIVVGFGIAVGIAVPLGMLIVASQVIDRLISPLLVGFNSLPKVALAPLFVVWFGYGVTPRIVITFSIAFFPILVDTVVGLKSVDPDMVRLGMSMNATKTRIFLRLRLPYALPNIFAGLRVGTSLAVIGGVIGEFIASQKGWGYLLIQAQGQLNTSLIFAILILLSVLATLMYYAVELTERVVIPWHASQRR